jgi:ABC-2 type transport system ATP-binding protein
MSALRIASLAKRYRSTRAVSDVSLNVDEGQIYGLLGPNGSGKTTTLSCALGLQRPDSGTIELLGQPARAIHRTQGRVGVVFDEPTLIPGLRVHQNLSYAECLLGHRGGRGIDEALELVGLTKQRRQRAGQLSLGQKRRLAIARALLGRPELLVLDEPLSGLDTAGVREVLQLVSRLRDDGLTLMLSSHRLHELERVVTHVGILMDGRIVREAPLPELLAKDRRAVVLYTDTPDAARNLLGPLVLEESTDNAGPTGLTRLRIDLRDEQPADLNHRLVGSGCRVSELRLERHSLQTVFEELLDARLDGAADATGGSRA